MNTLDACIIEQERKDFEAVFPIPARIKYSATKNRYVVDINANG
jgi:hypothetical protein